MNTIYSESEFAKNTLCKGLSSLREKRMFLDVTLIVDDEIFKAHKLVLTACSQYFCAMFISNMRESSQEEITLKGIKAGVFSQILNYFYESRIMLDESNIQDVLETSLYLQAEPLIQTCTEYLSSQVNVHTCLDIATLVEMYSLEELKMQVYRFMIQHLVELSSSKEFYRITPKQLEKLLALDFFIKCREADVLRLVLVWFFHVYYPSGNFEFFEAKRITQHIRFNDISRQELDTILEQFFQNINLDGEFYIKEMLSEAYSNKRINPRGMKLAILTIGGHDEKHIYNISFCFPKESKWKHLTSIPQSSPPWNVGESFFRPTVLNNELYIVGSTPDINFSAKYSPRNDEWKRASPMLIKGKYWYSLNALGSMLYVVGGSKDDENGTGTLTLQESERYDPVSDKWYTIKPFPVPITAHAGASYDLNSDLKLFISGGSIDGEVISSSMYSFSASRNEWALCAPMPRARKFHQMISIGNCLYVCGGYFDNGSFADTIDVYDIKTDTWKDVVIKVPTPRDFESVACVDRKIYFIGGQDEDYRPTDSIDSYDTGTDLWTLEDKYPETISEHHCISLSIPFKLKNVT